MSVVDLPLISDGVDGRLSLVAETPLVLAGEGSLSEGCTPLEVGLLSDNRVATLAGY